MPGPEPGPEHVDPPVLARLRSYTMRDAEIAISGAKNAV